MTKDKVHSSNQSWFLEKLNQLKKAILNLDYEYVIFDTSPGLHLFTINILSITQKIIILMKPDNISFRGVNYLLREIYTRSIQLTGKKSFEMNIVINQIPVLDKFEKIINDWHHKLSANFEFIHKIHNFYYDAELVYSTALEDNKLSKGNKFIQKLKSLVDKEFL